MILLETSTEMIDLPCFACKYLHKDLDKVRDEIALLMSNDSLPCVSCESLISEIKELTHITFVDQLEHARAKMVGISSRPYSLCSLHANDDACQDHTLVIIIVLCLM